MRRNWSDTVDLQGDAAEPTSAAAVSDLVRAHPQALALGSAHSFSTVAVTPGVHVETAHLPREMLIAGSTATVGAGMTYADVGAILRDNGVALAAMASLPHITVGGAIATGTHGSGDHIGTLSSAVTGLQIVTADGDIRWIRRETDADFAGWVVSLGALGVVTRVELAIEPTYDVAQTVFTGLDLDVVEAQFDAIFTAATSVSVFTRWRPEPDGQLWLKRRTDREGVWPGGDAFGAIERTEPIHPLETLDWGARDRGVTGYPTSVQSSHRVQEKRSRPNTSCRGHMPPRQFARCDHSMSRSRLCCTSPRSVRCALMICGSARPTGWTP